MPTKLVLIRHGQTDWNIAGRYQGFTDIDLNDTGVMEARELRRTIDRRGISRVYSSDSVRASHFARLVFPDLDINESPNLREMRFGIFEGLTYDEILARHGRVYRDWLDDPTAVTIPEGEDFYSFERRVNVEVSRIVSENIGLTAAIVTHAGPIRAILRVRNKAIGFWEIRPDNASVTTIEVPDG